MYTLEQDLYQPLGAIDFEAHFTYDYLTPPEAAKRPFAPIQPGEAWGREWQYAWLKSTVTLPSEVAGKIVVMDLRPGGESTLFVNGEEFGTYRASGLSQKHHYLVDNYLTRCGKPGETFNIMCEAYAGHYIPESPLGGVSIGPVLPGLYDDKNAGKERTSLGNSTYGIWNEDAYQLYMDATSLLEIMQYLPEGSLRAAKIGKALQDFTLAVDFEQGAEERDKDYRKAREILKPCLMAKNGDSVPTFYSIGNSHIDVVWLWPLEETKRKTARTFAAQLRLLEQYPDYQFIQSQPYVYTMVKENYPALYEKIKAAIKGGRWIAEGGMWVEPDTNMASGEALVRQLVHGLKFYKDEFGVTCKILWLPDTFGYTAALPQILKDCGIDYLVTQKIFWSYNGGEQFPYHYFNWQGMDGTCVTSFLPTSYTYTTNPKRLDEVWSNRVLKDDMDKFLLPYGYGDGGGGPCRDYIEYALRERDLEGCPKVELKNPLDLFHDLEADGGPKNTYVGELYFTAHRGTYTAQASIKRGNRKAELALREAEMWGAIALNNNFAYPSANMDAAWKKTLTNQFHDILPGSSIARVYPEAAALHNEVLAATDAISSDAKRCITTGDTPTVFNSLPWARKVVVNKKDGQPITVNVPSCGYAPVPDIDTFEPAAKAELTESGATLSNEFITAKINASGEITSFITKQTGREFAAGKMNQFLLYKDVPRLFDAWDIDSMYDQQPVEIAPSAKLTLVNGGAHSAVIKIEKQIGNSTLAQLITLKTGSKRLEFDTTIEWNELHRLLKVAFPVDVLAEEAIHEMQFGNVKRPTHKSRAYDQDRFEVCNHRYTALADESHGAAVLNDCKYGVSVDGHDIKLTLLRAEGSPEMRGDNTTHRFVYGFTAWNCPFLSSDVVREGYELNVPVVVAGGGGESASFFAVNSDSVILETVKPAEDNSGDIILRLYESKKADTHCELQWQIPNALASITNMMEEREADIPLAAQDRHVKLHFKPFEVKTIRLSKTTR
jgi:alpha-mannosidase